METGRSIEVTVAFDADTIDQLDELAERHHRGSREQAVRTLLDRWFDARET